MNAELTRPGILPNVLLEGHGWNVDAVRQVSFDRDTDWRAVLVTDDSGPVGALCFRTPEILPVITVDTVILHPERSNSITQLEALISAAVPVLRTFGQRFRATRIVWESVSRDLQAVLRNVYEAREDSVVLSMAIEAEPIRAFVPEPTPEPFASFASPCGRENRSMAGKSAHERHCAKCKEA